MSNSTPSPVVSNVEMRQKLFRITIIIIINKANKTGERRRFEGGRSVVSGTVR